jgi:hypothetical protein
MAQAPRTVYDNWLAAFCRDEHYVIIPNMGDGDCLFLSLGMALRKPVSFFRNLIAQHTPDERYFALRELYTQAERERNRTLLQDIGFMRKVHSPDGLRQFMRTAQYWGDEVAIDMLEQLLHVKLLILDSRRAYAGLSPCVFHTMSKPFRPRYYILLHYNGGHYELITYNGQALFAARDIPRALYLLFDTPEGNMDMVKGWKKRS